MMKEVDEAVYNLVDVICETKQFEDYQRVKAKLSGQPELRDSIQEFQKRNFELQMSDMDNLKLMEETDRLEREYEAFRANPLVNEFLACELAFNRLMQRVYDEIMEGIDYDI